MLQEKFQFFPSLQGISWCDSFHSVICTCCLSFLKPKQRLLCLLQLESFTLWVSVDAAGAFAGCCPNGAGHSQLSH